MQFAVPQFTDVEDKLIGPLTLKQFLTLLGFGGILFLMWSIIGANFVFYILAVPVVCLALYVTFKKFNGRPFFTYALPLMEFLSSPREMIFHREPAIVHFSSKQVKPEAKNKPLNAVDKEPAESRLKKLAYLLDQKFEEEKEIISESNFDVPTQGATKTKPAITLPKPKPIGLPKQFDAPSAKPKSNMPQSADSGANTTTATTSGFDPDNILRPKNNG